MSTVDLFAIWFIVLLGMAVLISGRLSRNKTIVVMAIYTALSLLVGAAPSLLLGAFTQGF